MNTIIPIIMQYINNGTLLPAVLLNDKEVCKLVKDSGRYQVPTLQELKAVVQKLEITEDELYLSVNPFTPFVYIRDLTYVDIQNLNDSYLDTHNVKETIHHLTKDIEELREKGKFEEIIHLTSNKYILNVFHEVYDDLPIEQKYSLFRATYTQMEYGFQAFQPHILEEVLNLNLDTSFKDNLTVDKEGYVTIYRGEGSKSRGVEEAYSWTTNKKVARFFAYRFDKEGQIYQGKVHVDNVIDFIDDRNEDEILVNPEQVIEIVEYKEA